MAQPREFDETAVIEVAMHCLWARGFEATSVRDVASEMGITGASMYNAFGDKSGLSIDERSSTTSNGAFMTETAAVRVCSHSPRSGPFFDEIIE
jgi:TetR/AcrR family transcriptional regulator, transcriptional repressor for nem operon